MDSGHTRRKEWVLDSQDELKAETSKRFTSVAMKTEQQKNSKAWKSLIFANSQTETEKNGIKPLNYIDVHMYLTLGAKKNF